MPLFLVNIITAVFRPSLTAVWVMLAMAVLMFDFGGQADNIQFTSAKSFSCSGLFEAVCGGMNRGFLN